MNDQEFIKIQCLEICQPIGIFYIAKMAWHDVLKISWSDVRRIENHDLDNYLGIQRELSRKRVDEIKRYVQTVDASFPTGIILSISSDDILSSDEINGSIRIKREENVAKIIDGQHRLAGLEVLKGSETKFDLNVTIFVDMDIEDQAMIFATINLAQTKVRKSLAYDLYEYTKSRSPQKTSHNIAKLLATKEDSPLLGRIKILGTATMKYQTLTQAAVVEAILPLISGSVEQALIDRDLLKRGKPLPKLSKSQMNTAVFRDLFENQEDAKIAKAIWDYFKAIQNRWPKSWNDLIPGGSILPRTNAFRAFIRYFPHIIRYFNTLPNEISLNNIYNHLLNIELQDEDFNSTRYIPGSTGERALLDDLLSYGKKHDKLENSSPN